MTIAVGRCIIIFIFVPFGQAEGATRHRLVHVLVVALRLAVLSFPILSVLLLRDVVLLVLVGDVVVLLVNIITALLLMLIVVFLLLLIIIMILFLVDIVVSRSLR